MYPNIRIYIRIHITYIYIYIYIYYRDISRNMIIIFHFFKYEYTEFPFQPYNYEFFLNSAQSEFETVQFQRTKLDKYIMCVTVLGATTFTTVIDPY